MTRAFRTLYDFGDSKHESKVHEKMQCSAGSSTSEECSASNKRSFCSIALAIVSTMLFCTCELPGEITFARSKQLLLAAFLCAALAALHTHAVLGKNLNGWRLYQPFHGGPTFVLLQTAGWITFSLMGLGVTLAVGFGDFVPTHNQGFMITLGIVQLLGQASLLLSLAHFDSEATMWSEKGVPVVIVAIAVVFAALSIGIAIHAGGSARRGAGWAILAIMLGMQALGVHYMWTLTWNFLTGVCLLIDSEFALATMACIGIGSICAPWYIGRTIFWRQDFCERAMVGQSAWICDEVFRFGGKIYMHNCTMWPLRLTFLHFDTVLHLLAGMMLLQQYGSVIRPIHALGSAVVTLFWFLTLFRKHNVLDMDAARGGRLKLVKCGEVSNWEPVKMAYIYMFKNAHIRQDKDFEEAVPGFLAIVVGAHVVTAVVAALPNSGDIFFALGLGHFVSTESLMYFSVYCFVAAISFLGLGCCFMAPSVLAIDWTKRKD